MPIETAYVLGLIFALVCTVLVFIFITPDKKRETLNPFFKFLHDLFNFKWLIIEKILKALYIFSTLFTVGSGFFLLFAGVRDYFDDFHSAFGMGLVFLILGPIFVRLVYEGLIMGVLLVKNAIQANSRLGILVSQNAPDAPDTPDDDSGSPFTPPAREPEYVYCGKCGTRYDKSRGGCPNCENQPKE